MRYLILFLLGVTSVVAMESFSGSRYVPTDWADGDSFRVKTAEGREFTVRLYGADCLETGPYTPSDARRLRDQRRYFGISEHGGSFRTSVELAERYGKLATTQVAEWLREPFTVHTGFADARGDARYERFYAFITMADGRDLAAALVSSGLARAFGVLRAHPDGRSSHEYGQSLADLEIQAAVRRKGIWEHTDWENLPEERRMLREYEEELRTTIRRPLVEGEFRVNPNTAARDELMRLPGIGETMAIRIIEGRPYAGAEALLKIPGIGETTLERIQPFLHFGDEAGDE
jgi:endonuclease YncB( thermonuclease family)